MARVLHFDRPSIRLTRFDVMQMANTMHPAARTARPNSARAKFIAASFVGLSSLFCAYTANAHSAIGMSDAAPCRSSAGIGVQTPEDADATAPESSFVVAVNIAGGAGMPKKNNPGIGGVIDRSVPRSGNAAGTTDANLTQFNRIPDTSNFTGAATTTGQAPLPDVEGGPALYTIIERPSPQQVRPVLYKPANAARPDTKGSAKRYCTVTEVLRSTAAACQ